MDVVPVSTAQQMCDAVLARTGDADALIMAAAVADYRPLSAADQKIKKSDDDLTIPLAKTVDILATAQGDFVRVGFAAESENLVEETPGPRLPANPSTSLLPTTSPARAAASAPTPNRVTLIDREMNVEELPLLTKYEVGNRILNRVAALLRV